jgi:acetyltransferase-like isoleucine patch superfamily enzyme
MEIHYFVIILLIVLFFLKIVLIISFPPIRIWNKYQQGKQKKEIEKQVNAQTISLFEAKEQSIKTTFARYISSYLKYSIFQVGYIPSHTLRNFLYKQIYLIDMSEKSVIHYGAEIRDTHKLKIEKGTIIGDRAILDARNGIIIGENVNFSSDVAIWTEQHDHRDPYFKCNSGEDFGVKIDNVLD